MAQAMTMAMAIDRARAGEKGNSIANGNDELSVVNLQWLDEK